MAAIAGRLKIIKPEIKAMAAVFLLMLAGTSNETKIVTKQLINPSVDAITIPILPPGTRNGRSICWCLRRDAKKLIKIQMYITI